LWWRVDPSELNRVIEQTLDRSVEVHK